MHGNKKFICIAGKNQCSIDFLKYTSSKIDKKNILVLPNKSDKGISRWQPSLKKYAKKNNIKIIEINSNKDPSFYHKKLFKYIKLK